MSIASAAFHVESCVVGGGVIGLATSRALAERGREVLILDRAAIIGSETSSRNSEVIHAGLYYPQDSNKAKFCVEGKQLLYEYCKSRHVPVNQCGKLVVATNESQWKRDLPKMKEQANKNGVLDVELSSCEQVQELEPQVDCFGALWSPSTGVVDSHSFMISLLADAEQHGATLALNSKVENAFVSSDGVMLEVDGTLISCQTLVNSAGLWADEIARMIHSDTEWKPPKQYFAKGNYFRLEGVKSPFQHLVYPVPEAAGGLGVHATIGWADNSVKFGPDVEWLSPDTLPDNIDMTPDPSRGESFYAAIRKYWSALPEDSLAPDYSGIRPKLSHPETPSGLPVDFYIAGKQQHGIPGLVHLLGMESPGLTSSMAIAEYVAEMLSTE